MRVRSPTTAGRSRSFPIGSAVTLEELEDEPYGILARLREHEPVSWLASLGGWLVTRHDLALEAMRSSATFTVDDPRFSTAQVVGRSMLSTDGDEHARHRDPFARAFRLDAVRARLGGLVEDEAVRLVAALAPAGHGELRRGVAGPLAVASMAHALGLARVAPEEVLAWYDAIVTAVTEITAGRAPARSAGQAFGALRAAVDEAAAQEPASSLLAAAAAAGGLSTSELVSNAAVLLFGGIETTEGMIANALLHLLTHPSELERVKREDALLPGAVEESLRLEPAAAVVDRYATRDVELGPASIGRGDLVRVSLTAANRDPRVFPDPDRFDVTRPNARRQLAFAQGPHVCLGMHLARVETIAAARAALRFLPGLRLDPDRPARVSGLVFRKPQALHVIWG